MCSKVSLYSTVCVCVTGEKKNSAAQENKSGGILSFLMPWRRSGPPRAKLPSDKEPRVRTM